MKNETKGIALALLAAVLSGIAIPANKLFIVTLDPTVFTAVRAIIIGAVFLAISLYQSRTSRRKFKEVPWKYLLSIAVIGGAFAFILYFNGLSLTTAGRAAFLQKTLPLFTAVLAFIFLKEKITKKMSLALVAMFAGMVILYASQITPSSLWSNPSLGDLLIIIATLLWAVENIIAKKAMIMNESNFVISFARMFFGGLILFGFVLLFGKFGILLSLSAQQWVNVLVSTALLFGYVLFWYWSIKHINVSKAAALLLIAPIISLVGGVVLFGEPVPVTELLGCAIILASAYLLVGIKSEFREKL
jgi:drug/metabolite transporter (DMT)-like permease